MSAVSFIKESVFAEEYALKKGFLQSLDPRVKAFTLLLFIMQGILTKNIQVLLLLYLFAITLAVFSHIRLWTFFKRTWIFIPLFSLFIALPSIFSFVTPGNPLAVFRLAGINLTVTGQGLSGASLFVLRVVNSVSYAILLSITTRHFELLRAIRAFNIPQVFVMTIGMCYRYIYMFAEIIENTYLAIRSRVGFVSKSGSGRRVVAWNIASLWHRSYYMNEEVYKAMLSRGYTGEAVVLDEFNIKSRDVLWSGFSVVVFIAIMYIRS